jgi:lipoprotein-anchoring transpeptidase ErfK/SrfK
LRIKRVSGHRFLSSGIAGAARFKQRFWQIAMLTAAGTLVAVPQADAATMFYWQDTDPGYSQPMQVAQPRKPKARKPSAKAGAAINKETNAKPQGPLIIAISIDQQKVRVYDANGLFAESPVSTGMKGHSTPMGVFSVIQKNKMHRSNIYSGAPMPFMQRITWSGVALHAGVLPGYPASHGCIRMPMAFAVKMWNWTRMGARVIITPGQITPANFAHPFLVAQKVVPQPLIATDPASEAPAVKSDKGADAGQAIKNSSLANSEPSLELRPTVGHAMPMRERTHTADAGSALSAANGAVTMSDAAPSAAAAQPANAKPSAEAKPDATSAVDAAAASATSADAKVEAGAEAKSDAVNVEAPTAAITKVEEANTSEIKTPEVKPSESKAAEKPVEPVKATADAPATPGAASDAKKDTARLPGAEKPAKAETPKRPGQIAVFVSRKDSKLYVRENFKPQYDIPITIAPSERPLGTHVFTAEADKKDSNLLRWSVISLPATRPAARTDEDRAVRGRKLSAAEIKPFPAPNSPAEALDRISIAPEAMARIAEVLNTGASIVVSDLGIAQGGETGEGTDFIIPLR